MALRSLLSLQFTSLRASRMIYKNEISIHNVHQSWHGEIVEISTWCFLQETSSSSILLDAFQYINDFMKAPHTEKCQAIKKNTKQIIEDCDERNIAIFSTLWHEWIIRIIEMRVVEEWNGFEFEASARRIIEVEESWASKFLLHTESDKLCRTSHCYLYTRCCHHDDRMIRKCVWSHALVYPDRCDSPTFSCLRGCFCYAPSHRDRADCLSCYYCHH